MVNRNTVGSSLGDFFGVDVPPVVEHVYKTVQLAGGATLIHHVDERIEWTHQWFKILGVDQEVTFKPSQVCRRGQVIIAKPLEFITKQAALHYGDE